MTRFSCHAAPALFFAYGLVRLLDGRDGDRGPGPAWTLGHLFFLAGLLLYGVVLVGLRRALSGVGGWRRYAATTATVLGAIGLLAFIRVAIIDIVVGLRAADHPGMGELFQRYENAPWGVVPAAVGEVVPVFFVVGMVALVTLLAVGRPRLLPGWSPVLVLCGFVIMTVNLDLFSIGAALLWLALAPLALRRSTEPAALLQRPC